jgi:putative transposase
VTTWSRGRRLGVELICHVLQVAPSSYYEFKNRQPSARTQRDEVMGPVVRQLWEDNFRVLRRPEDLEGRTTCWT